MSKFDYPIVYEDRDEIHTSRWLLSGVSTRTGKNLVDGRLWMEATDSANTVTVNLYTDRALGTGDKIATGTADISTVPCKCTLAASSSSGVTGEFYFEEYTTDPTTAVEIVVALAMDADCAIEFGNIAELPAFDETFGLGDCIAAATRKTLLLASQMFAEDLGGFGSPEHRYRPGADRLVPDYRCICNPDQLRDAATHWALMLAFASAQERRDDKTMYSDLKTYHDEKRKECIGAWNLTLNTDPSGDDDADERQHGGAVAITRL